MEDPNDKLNHQILPQIAGKDPTFQADKARQASCVTLYCGKKVVAHDAVTALFPLDRLRIQKVFIVVLANKINMTQTREAFNKNKPYDEGLGAAQLKKTDKSM